jgi:hypothetical protein
MLLTEASGPGQDRCVVAAVGELPVDRRSRVKTRETEPKTFHLNGPGAAHDRHSRHPEASDA